VVDFTGVIHGGVAGGFSFWGFHVCFWLDGCIISINGFVGFHVVLLVWLVISGRCAVSWTKVATVPVKGLGGGFAALSGTGGEALLGKVFNFHLRKSLQPLHVS